MKTLRIIALASLCLLPACGDSSATGGAGGAAGMLEKVGDAAKKTEAMSALQSTFTTLKSTLAGISDGSTAQAAKGKLEAMLSPLTEQLSALGGLDKLGSMKDGLVAGITKQLSSLLGNADIKAAIGPVLAQITSALKG